MGPTPAAVRRFRPNPRSRRQGRSIDPVPDVNIALVTPFGVTAIGGDGLASALLQHAGFTHRPPLGAMPEWFSLSVHDASNAAFGEIVNRGVFVA